MPHLNTSTWPIIITSMLLTLHLIMQLKLLNTSYHLSPSQKIFNTTALDNQNERKSIYSIHRPNNSKPACYSTYHSISLLTISNFQPPY